MREATIEALLTRLVKQAGGQCIKVVPVVAGVPDRLVLLPGGQVYLVELKAPEGRLRPVQRVWHERASAIGAPVVVLASKAEVAAWVDKMSRDVIE